MKKEMEDDQFPIEKEEDDHLVIKKEEDGQVLIKVKEERQMSKKKKVVGQEFLKKDKFIKEEKKMVRCSSRWKRKPINRRKSDIYDSIW